MLPALLVLMAALAIAALTPLLAPHSPTAQDIFGSLEPPAWSGGTSEHWLGTDSLGRDLLSRIFYGTRVSMAVSVSAVALSAAVGLSLGLVAGYFGGWIEHVLMTLAVVSALGPNLVNTVVVLCLTSWVVYARLVRGEVLALRNAEFVQAARVLGAHDLRVLARHVFPQVLPSLLVLVTLQLGLMVMLEGTLSFLGLGVQPPDPSLGNLLADSRDYFTTAWWLAVFPGLMLSSTVWAINLTGDWLRDELDPRLRR
jgi:peptide/nickel transport system permease protein